MSHTLSPADGQAVRPERHTMGQRLGNYVLPKVPSALLRQAGGRAWVYTTPALSLLVGRQKPGGKRFNWRRPLFTTTGGLLHCVLPPGADYAHHYTRLIATAGVLNGLTPQVDTEFPRHARTLEFLDRWLPPLPAGDAVIMGYVEHLFTREPGDWVLHPGFGWRVVNLAGTTAVLLGCEFSFWGGLAGGLVTLLAARACAERVIYVGKLGALCPALEPNTVIATGTTSLLATRQVRWTSGLNLTDPPRTLRTSLRHVTVPSVMDETRAWYHAHDEDSDVTDPEIGHMAAAATRTGLTFDYLHIVTDNLCGTFEHGLYDERRAGILAGRRRCLSDIETIVYRSLT